MLPNRRIPSVLLVAAACHAPAPRAAGLRAIFLRDARRSDQASFADAGIPVAMLTTVEHGAYHTVRDVAGRINGSGLLTIIDVAEAIVRSAAEE